MVEMDYMELDSIDYKKSNELIRELLKNEQEMINLQFLEGVRKIAFMIIDTCREAKETENFSTKMSLNDSVYLAYEFFCSIHKDYGYRFLNILYQEYIKENNGNRYLVHFNEMSEEESEDDRYSFCNYDGGLEIFVNGTLGDLYAIVHEFTHKLIVPVLRDKDGEFDDNVYILGELFGETPTILNEFLLDDFILDKFGHFPDGGVSKKNRISDIIDEAIYFLFVSDVLGLYQKFGRIDKMILRNFFDSMDHSSQIFHLYKEFGIDFLKNDIVDSRIQLADAQRYILGFVVASFLHQEIKDNPNRIQDIIKFNSILGNSDYELYRDVNILSKMNIPIIRKNGIYMDDKTIHIFRKCLEEEVKDFVDVKKNRKV